MLKTRLNDRWYFFGIIALALLFVVPVLIMYIPLIGSHQSQPFIIEPSCSSSPRINVEIIKDSRDAKINFKLSAQQKDCTLVIAGQRGSSIFSNKFYAKFTDAKKLKTIYSDGELKLGTKQSGLKSKRNEVKLVVPSNAKLPGHWEVGFLLKDSVARTSFSDYVLLLRPTISWPELRRELREKKVKTNLDAPAVLKKDYKQAIGVRAPPELVYMSSAPSQPISVGSMEKLVTTNFRILPKGSDLQVHYKDTSSAAKETLFMFFASSFFGFILGVIADRLVVKRLT